MSDDDGPVVDPDDLDFTADESVHELEEGRFVVSPNGGPPRVPPDSTPEEGDGDDRGRGEPEGSNRRTTQGSPEITAGDVSRWLAASFSEDGFTYGFDATLSTEEDIVRHRLVSNDVTTTFETLLTWFARHAAGEAPPEESLGILLAAAETPVQFPPGTLKQYVDAHGLSPDDSVGDLLAVAEAHGGLRVGEDLEPKSRDDDAGGRSQR